MWSFKTPLTPPSHQPGSVGGRCPCGLRPHNGWPYCAGYPGDVYASPPGPPPGPRGSIRRVLEGGSRPPDWEVDLKKGVGTPLRCTGPHIHPCALSLCHLRSGPALPLQVTSSLKASIIPERKRLFTCLPQNSLPEVPEVVVSKCERGRCWGCLKRLHAPLSSLEHFIATLLAP